MSLSAPASPVPPRPRSRLLDPRFVLVALVLAGYSAFALIPGAQHKLGIPMGGIWFLDSYAVLAASDAVQVGLDPFVADPLDATGRLHSYSSWWFQLARLGLSRTDNPAVGGAWVLAFFVVAYCLFRPGSDGAAVWYALLLLSPPILLAVVRANNDLVVFALLGAGLLAGRPARGWRVAVFPLLLALATGLKFYPLVAGLTLLLVRPPRRMLTVAALTLVGGGLVLASVWRDLQRASIPAPTGIYIIGAMIPFRDLGFSRAAALGGGMAFLAASSFLCWRRGWYFRLATAGPAAGDSWAFACGAALLVGCYLAGISYVYRLVFVIFTAPFIWRSSAGRKGRWPAAALLAVMWLEGFLCWCTNEFIGPMRLEELLRVQFVLRLFTQPGIWALMIMLAASLWAMGHAAWRDWRGRAAPAA